MARTTDRDTDGTSQDTSSQGRRTRRPRRPGRPPGGREADDVRRQLVAAARELSAQRGFGEVGIRELADAAGVTPGMISYYFGGKQGLYEAMLASVFEQMLARVRELAAQPDHTADSPLAVLIRTYVGMLAQQPWVPALMLREVVTGDPEVRARFIERFAQHGATLLPGLVSAEIADGALRDDLDPALTVMSVIGASMFPFLAYPLLGKLFGYEIDEAFAERLCAHTTRLVLDGTRPRRDPS
jgi:TetR/AcrR family transcriptional regulator